MKIFQINGSFNQTQVGLRSNIYYSMSCYSKVKSLLIAYVNGMLKNIPRKVIPQ